MAKVERVSVALPREMIAAVQEAVASGEYATASEVVRDALRDWKLKRKLAAVEVDELRRLVQEGAASGPGVDGELVFARLREKYAAMAEE